MATREENLKKLETLIHDIDFAMLTTIDEDGSLRARPMSTQKTDFNGELWFFTKIDSPKIDEIEKDRQVCVAYSDPKNQHYVSMSGKANATRDRAKMEELWSPELKAWFPDGLDDPQISLLHVAVEKAEYWDTPNSTIIHLIGLAKAAVTGEEYHPGENEKVNL